MRSLCSWVLCTCLLVSNTMMAQSSSDTTVPPERQEGWQMEKDDSLSEDEMALLLERWEDKIDQTFEGSTLQEWMIDLEEERNLVLAQHQKAEKELSGLELENQGLILRQGELVGLIRDLAIEEEPSILDDSIEDSIEQIQVEERQESIRIYAQELSLIEQALYSKEVTIRTKMATVDDLRERLYELDTEIEEMKMIQTPMNVLTTIDDE